MILNIIYYKDALIGTGDDCIVSMDPNSQSWRYLFRDTTGTIGQIRSMQFADDGFGIATGFNGNILITTDGGVSFEIKKVTSNRLRSVCHLGNADWLVAGDNNKTDDAVLFLSKDNGKSWVKYGKYEDVHRITSTTDAIWAVGKKGLILRMKRK